MQLSGALSVAKYLSLVPDSTGEEEAVQGAANLRVVVGVARNLVERPVLSGDS
jgi:hypothetical protein